MKDNDLEMTFQNYFSFCWQQLTTKKKLTSLLIMVNFHLIDIDYNDFLIKYSSAKKDFNPSDLDSKNEVKRLEAREVMEKTF